MRRPGLEIGVALVALGAVSLVEGWRLRDGWLGARLMPLVIGLALVGLGVTLGLLGLTFFAPLLAEGALRIGPPEYFGLVVLDFSVVVNLSSRVLFTGGGVAVVHPSRLPGFPDIPTAHEAGFPDLNVVGWQGLTGPKGLPAPVVAQWVRLIEDASKDPAFIEQAVRINKVLAYRGPDAFWAFQNEELAKYLPLATKMGVRK